MARFPDNARVCFIGDSITHMHTYVAHIAAYYHKHFPGANINFYNTGVSGGTVGTALDIFDMDIAPMRPTHAVITLGVNDSGRDILADGHNPETYRTLKQNFENYQANMAKLCSRLEALGVKILLCTPFPIDEYGNHPTAPLPGSYALMLRYAEFVRAYAKEHGYAFCDYFVSMTEACQAEVLYCEDRIHPTPRGQYFIAKAFLTAQGLELGEEQPIPTSMERWCRNVDIHRNLRAAEYLLLHDYHLSVEEGIAQLSKLLAVETLSEFLVGLIHCYIENKTRETEVLEEILLDMEQNFKKVLS